MKDLSFLISSARKRERNALSEVYYVLHDQLKYAVIASELSIPGLALITLTEPPSIPLSRIMKDVLRFFSKDIALQDCLKIIPLEKIVPSKIDIIIKTATELAQPRIDNYSWKITVNKRHTQLSSTVIKREIASRIHQGRVNLTDPDYEIRIEIIGKDTGISFINPNLIYYKHKREK